jgi:hypothetical protein
MDLMSEDIVDCTGRVTHRFRLRLDGQVEITDARHNRAVIDPIGTRHPGRSICETLGDYSAPTTRRVHHRHATDRSSQQGDRSHNGGPRHNEFQALRTGPLLPRRPTTRGRTVMWTFQSCWCVVRAAASRIFSVRRANIRTSSYQCCEKKQEERLE